MRLFTILFLLLRFLSFSQPVSVEITSITSGDSLDYQREFKLTYLIKNNTADTLKLFWKSGYLSSNQDNQTAKFAYYKIYEGDLFLNIGTIFSTKGKRIASNRFSYSELDENKSKEDFENTYIDFLRKNYQTSRDAIDKIYKEEGFEGLVKFEGKMYMEKIEKNKIHYQVLNPNQKVECTATFNWDKKRYYFSDPNEYYLDENAKHFLEITLVALKEEFKSQIDTELYAKIKDNPNFIKGVFVSNKVEINLKPD